MEADVPLVAFYDRRALPWAYSTSPYPHGANDTEPAPTTALMIDPEINCPNMIRRLEGLITGVWIGYHYAGDLERQSQDAAP